MTAPIDIECPYCKATAGNLCTSGADPKTRLTVTFHHADRVDAAFRATTRRRDDPRALRDMLREAVDRLAKHEPTPDDWSFIITAREEYL